MLALHLKQWDNRMTPSAFKVDAYLADMASDLVREFARSGMTDHPVSKGSIKETRSREKLEALLPGFVSATHGFVVDSYGEVSHQSDLILCERHISCRFDLGSPDAI